MILMDKLMIKSKTIWGALLWVIDILLTGFEIKYPAFQPIVRAIASFLVVYGLRDAVDKK